MYIARNQSIKAHVFLYTETERVKNKALIDSGATECLIYPRFLKNLSLKTVSLPRPQIVQNVDETINQFCIITKAVELMVQYGNRITPHRFLVANIGKDNLILGFPFLKAAEPKIDWAKGQLGGDIYLMEREEWQELENNVMFYSQIT